MASHTPARSAAPRSAALASPTPRPMRRGPLASVSRDTPSVAEALASEREARRAGGGTAVNPALARMHERLRARRPLNASDVPAVALGGALERAERVEAAVSAAPEAPRAEARPAPGLQRFMRLRGLSGRTYVFSRIEPRHVSLYRNGVFAWVGRDGAQVIGEALPIVSNAVDDGALYVHLLAQDDGDRADVLADLK